MSETTTKTEAKPTPIDIKEIRMDVTFDSYEDSPRVGEVFIHNKQAWTISDVRPHVGSLNDATLVLRAWSVK